MQSFIENMPKAELHVHLEGTLEPELSFALAKKNNIQLAYSTPEALIEAYNFHDLPSFLTIYYSGMDVLRTQDDFFELTMAYFEKVHRQNVVYVELFFDPQAHTSRGIEFSTVITGIRKAQEAAASKFGLQSQLIMCFLRELSAESAMQHLEMALPHLSWLVGVGLDSNERDNPPIEFAAVFKKARELGLKLTMHCDVNQKNTLVHIGQCLDDIQVDRIDHGINSLEDSEIMQKIRDKKIGLTVCPVSNRFVVQSLTAKEIRTMLEAKMLVTINSDDPAYFRAYMNENLIELQKEGDFTAQEITRLVANGFEIAWIPNVQKQAYLESLDVYLTTKPN